MATGKLWHKPNPEMNTFQLSTASEKHLAKVDVFVILLSLAFWNTKPTSSTFRLYLSAHWALYFRHLQNSTLGHSFCIKISVSCVLPSDVSAELFWHLPTKKNVVLSVVDGIFKTKQLKLTWNLLPIFVPSGIIDFSTKFQLTQSFELMAQILE